MLTKTKKEIANRFKRRPKTLRHHSVSRRAGAMVEHLPLGHTAEVRAQKMRALRAEAGKQAKAGLDAIRERCAPATAFPAVSERHRFPPIRLLLSTARAL